VSAGIKRLFLHHPPVHSSWLSVRGIGIDVPMPPGLVHRPRGSGDHLFVHFDHPAWLSEAGRTRQRPAKSLMLWAPGQHQCYGNPQRPYTLSWLHCYGQRVRNLLRELKLPMDQAIVPVDGAPFRTMLLAIYRELTDQVEPEPVIVGNLLENWLRSLARQLCRRSQPGPVPTELLELKQHLDASFTQSHGLESLAQRVHLSVPHLCSLFRQHFGISPIQYIIRARLHHAVYLLQDWNLSVAQIAREVGYNDLYHFSKLFKKHYGIGPREMRRRMWGPVAPPEANPETS
jgi:AraC family transcriptional regulator, arabinose operon regulatory protein